ncbi:hypothetical protein EDB83DRAFT_1127967 [Lactarius deliciosus]|nr:hypothetical protein EDB83DRAFT_1127967 [Lactarius deliciosus]
MLLQGMLKTAEETALKSPSEIDTRAFLWTFDSLDEDHELERFFSGLPGFRNSKVVDDPLPGLTEEQKEKLSTALTGLLDVTFSSDLVPEPVKHRRAIICTKAFDPAHIPGVSGAFDRIWTRYQYTSPMTAEIVQIMSGWGNYRRSDTDLVVAVCRTVAMAQRRDDSWFILACDELGVQEPVLREYAAHGDSLSLSILIHVTRQQFSHLWDWRWPDNEFSDILEAASKFSAQDTLPELRHEFCALWNQVRSDDSRLVARLILRPIRSVYSALHQETGSAPIGADLLDPSSYPLCNIAGHRPGSTPRIHDVSTCTPFTRVALPVPASIVSPEVPSLSVPAPPHGHHPDSTPHIHDDSVTTTFAQTVLQDNTALVPAPLTSPDTLSSSLPVPLYVGESITDMAPLDNFHPEHQNTIAEGLHIPVTSPDPAAASTCEIREVITLGITRPHTSLGTSPSVPPTSLASTSPRTVTFQHFADHCTSSGVLDAPLLPSPPSVLNTVLPTESHSSPLTPTAPNPSRPRLSSAPSLDAAEEEGSAKATLPKDKDALDPPSSIRDNVIAAPDLPSQPLSPFPVPDVVITAPSLRSLGTENTGDHPPNQSYNQHDIV